MIYFISHLVSKAYAVATITVNGNIPGPNNISTTGPGGFVANFYLYALLVSGLLAFGAIVYGGVKYATGRGNPTAESEGRSWITGALWGLLLLAGAYVLLRVINPALTNLNAINQLSLNGMSSVQSGMGSTGSSLSGSSSANCGSLTAGVAAGSYGDVTEADEINSAAASYCGASTAGGPGNGTVSCAWAVNNVLASVAIAPLDSNSVQGMENALEAGRGTLVSPSQAMPGDIVIQAQDGHVGICVNVGCTQVISNSSSNASFTWISDTSFSPSYSGGPGRIYRLNS